MKNVLRVENTIVEKKRWDYDREVFGGTWKKKVENERWEKETQKQKEKSENSLLKQIENNELIVGKNPSETASNIFLPLLSYFNNKTITTK